MLVLYGYKVQCSTIIYHIQCEVCVWYIYPTFFGFPVFNIQPSSNNQIVCSAGFIKEKKLRPTQMWKKWVPKKVQPQIALMGVAHIIHRIVIVIIIIPARIENQSRDLCDLLPCHPQIAIISTTWIILWSVVIIVVVSFL